MSPPNQNRGWLFCDDIDLAAAFATLGVPCEPDVQISAESGKETAVFKLGTESLVNPQIKTALLMRLVREGRLEKEDPDHPLLYALLGIKNLHAIRQAVKTSKRIVMIRKKGSQRCAYVHEDITDAGLDKAQRFLNGALFH